MRRRCAHKTKSKAYRAFKAKIRENSKLPVNPATMLNQPEVRIVAVKRKGVREPDIAAVPTGRIISLGARSGEQYIVPAAWRRKKNRPPDRLQPGAVRQNPGVPAQGKLPGGRSSG